MAMQQVALLPSGPTNSPLSVIKSHKGRFAVCATLAVYVYDSETYALENVISFLDKKLMSVSWSADGQKLATVSLDSCVYVADIHTSVTKLVYQSKFQVVNVTCCPRKQNVIYVTSSANLTRLELIETQNNEDFSYTVEKTNIVSFSSTPTSVDFKQVGGGPTATTAGTAGDGGGGLRATVSLDDGMIVHVDVLTKKVLGRFKTAAASGNREHSHVVHVSWDPLSNQYFAAAHKDGNLSLWDAESGSAPIFHFAKQPSGSVKSVVWMPSVPGGFITFSCRGGVIRVWNVSNPTPLSSIKVDCSGIKDICMPVHAPSSSSSGAPSQSNTAFCAFADRVAVLDLDTKKVVWETPPGHVDTIFACIFHVHKPDLLLTAGYDQCVKEWDVLTNGCVRTFASAGGLIYDMRMRRDGLRVATALDNGEVKVFDYKTGLLAYTIPPPRPQTKAAGAVASGAPTGGAFAAYHVSWFEKDSCASAAAAPADGPTLADGDDLIIGYGNGMLQLTSKSGEVRASLRVGGLKERVSCAVDPHDSSRLAAVVGPFVHIIQVDTLESGAIVLSKLASVSAADKRTAFFAAAFSPHTPGAIAATSDDKTVSVFSISASEPVNGNVAPKKPGGACTMQRTLTLKGHTKKARAIVWHTELPWLLLSSSWDGSVIAWDVRDQGSRVCSATGHSADVYGLAVHPSRPFVLATTSRDSTIRFWEFTGRFRVPALRAIVGDAFTASSSSSETQQQPDGGDSESRSSSAESMLLCGEASARLSQQLRDIGDGSSAGQLDRRAKDVPTNDATSVPHETSSADCNASVSSVVHDPQLQRVKLISEFFFMPMMHKDLWSLVHTMKESRRLSGGQRSAHASSSSSSSSSSSNETLSSVSLGGCVPHVSAIERSIRQQALERRNVGASRSFGMGALARQHALQESASMYMKVGDTRAYCEVMVQMGEWQRALVLAPAVSLEYWHELLDRYTREQLASSGVASDAKAASVVAEAGWEVSKRQEQGNVGGRQRLAPQKLEDLTPLMIATGRHETLVDLMIMNEQYDDACALTKMSSASAAAASSDGKMCALATETEAAGQRGVGGADPSGTADDAHAGHREESDKLESIRHLQADKFMARGRAIEAACCHLSVDDVDGCLAKMLRGNEIELALLLMQAIGPRIRQPTEALLYMFGVLASDVDLPSVAFTVVEGMQMRLLERTVITVRHCARLSDAEAEAFHAAHGMRSLQSYAEEAAGYSKLNLTGSSNYDFNCDKAVEKLRLLLLARKYADAVELGLECLKSTMSRKAWCKDEVEPIVRLISLVDIEMLFGESSRRTGDEPAAGDDGGAAAKRDDGSAGTSEKQDTGISPEQLMIRVMFYASYIAALNAMQLGYAGIVRALLTMAIDCAAKITEGCGPNLPTDVLVLERERFSAQHEASVVAANVDAVTKNVIVIDNVETAVEKMPSSKAVGSGFDSLKKLLESQLYANTSSLSRSRHGGSGVATRHGSIPCFSEFKRAQSILGHVVRGKPCILEDGKSFMSVDDAIAWRRLCAFSPLCTGRFMPTT